MVEWWNFTGISGEFLFLESSGVRTVWQPGNATSTSNSVLIPLASPPSKFPNNECADKSSLAVGSRPKAGRASRPIAPPRWDPEFAGLEPETAIPLFIELSDVTLFWRPVGRGESTDFWACFSKSKTFRIGSRRCTLLSRQKYSMFSLRKIFIRWRRTLASGVNLKAMGTVPFKGNAFPEIRIS